MSELVERIMQATRQVRAAHQQLYGDDLPYDLFPADLAFVGPLDLSREQFVARVIEQDQQWQAEDPQPDWRPWDADEVVLRRPQVVVLYEAPPKGPNQRWLAADLRAKGGQFTAGELMYQFYRAAAADLDGGDKQAFQGFEFVGFLGTVPVYRAFLGG
jgi:hypothetical protein